MKWYQPVECDNIVENPLVCDSDNLGAWGFDPIRFKEGKEIVNWGKGITFGVRNQKNNGNPDDALQNHLTLPIFSERLVNTLQKNNIDGIQFLPIEILLPSQKKLLGFSIGNFINFVAALDYKHSDYSLFGNDFPNPRVRGKIAGVKKFVLIAKKIEGLDIIRLSDFKQRFFVSEKVRALFHKNKFTGYSFKEIELTL